MAAEKLRAVQEIRSAARRHGQDPGVVVAEPEPGRQHRWVGMVELDADAAPCRADRDVGIETPVLDPEVVEVAKRLPGEVTKLWMMALGLELGDDHNRQHYAVLSKPADGRRVREQDAGVEDIRAATPANPGDPCSLARPGGTRQPGGGSRCWLRTRRVRSRCGPAC